MSRRPLIAVIAAAMAVAVCAVAAEAHDLFLRPRNFVIRAGSEVLVRVLNGTFTTSESPVARERLRALTIAGPAGRSAPDQSAWSDGDTESRWRVTLNEPGTHVLGASLEPRTIRMGGTDFNGYLRTEGLPDILEARRGARQLGDSAHERYAKHVKALVRVQGNPSTGSDTAYRAVFGYPAELVALEDPYTLRAGGMLRVRALVDGRPTPRLVVQAGGRTMSGARIAQRETRTDSAGIASFRMNVRGTWYVKFISMRPVPATAGDSVNYESKWATLTFARP